MTLYVRVRVASETYAMPVANVVEVAELGPVRAVPRARPELLGIRNLRGQILPVIDLGALLGVSPTRTPAHLLLAEAGGRQAGFAIEEVSGIGELDDPSEETESDLLLGAALSNGALIGVIDMPAVFSKLDYSA
ncbi:MAG TPA: chemotaxis protein CheW [Streptosporangiaceae bacterium]|nr:chemotaxis protein CheW [Streptosporangiaceae bacterium]